MEPDIQYQSRSQGLRWGGGGRGGGGGGMMRKKKSRNAPVMCMAMATPLSLSSRGVELRGGPPPSRAAFAAAYQRSPERSAKRSKGSSDVAPPPKMKPHTTSDKHTALISLQQADGNWQFNTALATVLAKPLEKLESSCPVPCKGNIREIWATILALAFLETVCARQKDEWELVAFKAEGWLQGQPLPSGFDMTTLKEAAKKSI